MPSRSRTGPPTRCFGSGRLASPCAQHDTARRSRRAAGAILAGALSGGVIAERRTARAALRWCHSGRSERKRAQSKNLARSPYRAAPSGCVILSGGHEVPEVEESGWPSMQGRRCRPSGQHTPQVVSLPSGGCTQCIRSRRISSRARTGQPPSGGVIAERRARSARSRRIRLAKHAGSQVPSQRAAHPSGGVILSGGRREPSAVEESRPEPIQGRGEMFRLRAWRRCAQHDTDGAHAGSRRDVSTPGGLRPPSAQHDTTRKRPHRDPLAECFDFGRAAHGLTRVGRDSPWPPRRIAPPSRVYALRAVMRRALRCVSARRACRGRPAPRRRPAPEAPRR